MALEHDGLALAQTSTIKQEALVANRSKPNGIGGSVMRQASDESTASGTSMTPQEIDASSGLGDDEPCFELDREEFKIDRQIGAGASAIVFLADWKGKQVAIKRMRRALKHMSHKDQVSLAREVAILALLSHPNLVRFYGTCFRTRPLLLVFELCEGGSLFELLHNCHSIALSFEQRMKMLCDVATAVAYLHAQNPLVVHRDLKSLNLLLAHPMTGSAHDIPCVKVTDFGLARTKDIEDIVMTSNVGSIYWMAPEVIEGSRYDEKVDVYSFAMVLYEVVCRRIPFDDIDPTFQVAQVAEKVLMGYRPELGFVPPDCPDCLLFLQEACWAHDSTVRPTFESILVTLRSPDLYIEESTSQMGMLKSQPLSEFDRFHSLSGK